MSDNEVAAAVEQERQRCLNILLDQFSYWRDIESHDQVMMGICIGAVGALSNVVHRVLDPSVPMMAKLKEGIQP